MDDIERAEHILSNIRASYRALERQVVRTLRTQMGAVAFLQEQRQPGLLFLQTIQQVTCQSPMSCSQRY